MLSTGELQLAAICCLHASAGLLGYFRVDLIMTSAEVPRLGCTWAEAWIFLQLRSKIVKQLAAREQLQRQKNLAKYVPDAASAIHKVLQVCFVAKLTHGGLCHCMAHAQLCCQQPDQGVGVAAGQCRGATCRASAARTTWLHPQIASVPVISPPSTPN